MSAMVVADNNYDQNTTFLYHRSRWRAGMTYYAILGIPSDADQETIRTSYRNLVRRYHPDAGAGSSPEKFRNVVEAYETLSDPDRRAIYDRSLRPTPVPVRVRVEPITMRAEPLIPRSPYRHSDINDLFETLVRSFFLSPWGW